MGGAAGDWYERHPDRRERVRWVVAVAAESWRTCAFGFYAEPASPGNSRLLLQGFLSYEETFPPFSFFLLMGPLLQVFGSVVAAFYLKSAWK